MTDPTNPTDRTTESTTPGADESHTWTADDPTRTDPTGDRAAGAASTAAATASGILETIKDVVDDLAERAAPTVRELSAKAAELAAGAADRAAPMVKKAGEATADASGKLAEKSRTWAADLRSSTGGHDAGGSAPNDTSAPSDRASDLAQATTPSDSLEDPTWTDPSDASPAFEPGENRPAGSSSDPF